MPTGTSLEQVKKVRKGFQGGIRNEVAGIILGVPQRASLFNPVAHVPSPTRSVPILILD